MWFIIPRCSRDGRFSILIRSPLRSRASWPRCCSAWWRVMCRRAALRLSTSCKRSNTNELSPDGFGCGKSQADVVGKPGSPSVAQQRLQLAHDFVEEGRALVLAGSVEEWLGESLEPGRDVAGKPCKPRNQFSAVNREARGAQDRGIFLCRGEVPGIDRGRVDAARSERRLQSGTDFADISLTSEFAYESAAGPQRAPNSRRHGCGHFHPMKSGVGEDGIEFVFEAKTLAVHNQDL